jgi:1-acyl-sn-glycerol-3-phosphate acyltransferase
MPLLYWLMKLVLLGPWLRLIFRPVAEGLEHVPRRGAAIIASNHVSFSDSIFMPLVVRRKVTFVAKAEYFTGTGIKGFLIRMFFTAAGTIPIDRSGGQASQAAIDTGLRVLRGGNLFGIYPEGTRSPDGRLYRGRTGVGWLALASGVPVIPVAMVGTDRVLPHGHSIPSLRRISIRVGEPLTFEAYRDHRPAAQARRAITDEVMKAIGGLSGQEYVPMYASVRKDEQNPRAAAGHQH